MKFEKLNYSSGNVKKAFVIGFIICALAFIIINLFLTRAKYKLVESRKLASGTINYTLVDFELAEIKFKASDSEDYTDVSTIEDNYELNQDMSYCTEKYSDDNDNFRDVKNDSLTINFDNKNKTISVSPYSKKGTKCHLFFDEKEITSKDVLEDILKQSSKGNVPTIIDPACDSCTMQNNGIYKTEDDFGDSYVYRGTIENNWVVFGKDTSDNDKYIWWRIIRINGNGTIRLIYTGTNNSQKSAPSKTGNGTMIKPRTEINYIDSYKMAIYFNQTATDNTYVGYMTGGTSQSTFENTHTNTKNSTILDEIVNWYNNNTNLSTLAEQYIDVDTGFCGDRGVSKTSVPGYLGSGCGNEQTAYVPWGRLYNGSWQGPQKPTLKCGTDDASRKRYLYTGPNATKGGTKSSNGTLIEGNNALPVPVGLITSDEVVYAGGFGSKYNTGYWLTTNRDYWTMSPGSYYYSNNLDQHANVFIVDAIGTLSHDYVNKNAYGARPVINLKADTKITFDNDKPAGTTTNPYIVEIP